MSYRDVRGWFNFEDVYSEFVQTAQPGDTLVEVGVWCGKSIIFLAEQIKASGKDIHVFGVDTFLGDWGSQDPQVPVENGKLWHAFVGNIRREGVTQIVTPMCLPSVQAAAYFEDQSLHAVFIDGEHSYEAVRADIAAWRPKVKPGGWLAGHDWDYEPVARAVREHGDPAVRGACWLFRI
jgi:cephalosporin hydroxylase